MAASNPKTPRVAPPRVKPDVSKKNPVDIARQEEEHLVTDLRDALVAKYGSPLRCWRELDRNGDGSLSFMEFAEAISRIGWSGDISKVWRVLVKDSIKGSGDPVISLHDISPYDAHLLDSFSTWVTKEFGGAIEMFQVFDTDGSNSLSLEEFLEGCQSFGSEEDLKLLYTDALDLRGKDDVSLSEVLFLEDDRLKRRAALDPQLVLELEEGRRLAKRNRRRRRQAKVTQQECLKSFKKKLAQAASHSFIRGWRKILDLDGNLTISKAELFKGCKQIAYEGDILVLWRAMDIDGDGFAVLEEVHPESALILAGFKKWCEERSENCVKALEQLGRNRRKWNVEDFFKALRDADFCVAKGAKGERSIQILHAAMDLSESGSISPNDAAFLDHWMPTTWLLADANIAGKDQFLEMLGQRYSSMLVAWRRLLDRSGTNCVAYKEFVDCCKLLKMEDQAPGIWRAFDQNCSGSISLLEVDPGSQKVLENFKKWAESTFGNIYRTFHHMAKEILDSAQDRPSFSFPEFKKAVREFGYKGDARILFDCLKPEDTSKKQQKETRITYEDMKHLEMWPAHDDEVTDDGEKEEPEEEGEHTPREPQHTWERRRKICGRCNRAHNWTTAREICEHECRLTGSSWTSWKPRICSACTPNKGHSRRKRYVLDTRAPLSAESHEHVAKQVPKEAVWFTRTREEFTALAKCSKEKPKPWETGGVDKLSEATKPSRSASAGLPSPKKIYGDKSWAVQRFLAIQSGRMAYQSFRAATPGTAGSFRPNNAPSPPEGGLKTSQSLPKLTTSN